MSLPDNPLTLTEPLPYIEPDDLPFKRLVSHERGGIALNDPSQGLDVQNWRLESDGSMVRLFSEMGSPIDLFPDSGIRQLSLTFDQNMRTVIAAEYISGGVDLIWYDTLAALEETTFFSDIRAPVVSLDDKRESQSGTSDVIFGYVRNSDNMLCYRQQRERFNAEHELVQLAPRSRLRNLGMTEQMRMQFEVLE